MTRTLTGRLLAAILSAMLLASLTAAAALAAPPDDLTATRAATARFNSITQAIAAGYGLLPEGTPLNECIMALDGSGGMGFHYVNGALLDESVEATAPEVLVYAPDENGKLKLVALEYVVFQQTWADAGMSGVPELFGEEFHATGEPNRYEIPAFFALHVWLWDENPTGLFEDFNPNVTCD